MSLNAKLDVCLCGWEKTKLATTVSSFSKSWICKQNHRIHWVGPCCFKDGKCTYHQSSQITSTGILWASQVALRNYTPIQSCFGGYIPHSTSYANHVQNVLTGNKKISLAIEGIGTFSNTAAFFRELKNRKHINLAGSTVPIITGIRSSVYLYDEELNGAWLVKISHKGFPTILSHLLFAPATQSHAVYTVKINLSSSVSSEFCFSASPCTHPAKKECIKTITHTTLLPGTQTQWTFHRNAIIQT